MSTAIHAPAKTNLSSKEAPRPVNARDQTFAKPFYIDSQSPRFSFGRIEIQPKLRINRFEDISEKEADRAAEAVMGSFHNKPPRFSQPASCIGCMIERMAKEKSSNHIQVPEKIEKEIDTVRSQSGRPLDPETLQFMESRFGWDFSNVRIHVGESATRSAESINALAYTIGNDIVFGSGLYEPNSSDGRKLLAHELVHVVQQTSKSGQIRPHEINRYANSTVMRNAEEEGPGFFGTILGGLMGEFREDPTFAMIGVDLGVSLVPILDQASDIRDILAHLYFMIFESQYSHFMRWVGLVFTLIGLMPEVGTVIKSASKFVIRGVGEVVSHLDEIFAIFRRIAPDMGDVRRLQMYITRHWNSFIEFARRSWNETIARVSSAASIVSSSISDIVRRIRDMAPEMMSRAFEWIRLQWNRVLDSVGERIGRRERLLWSTWEDYPKVSLPHPRTGEMTEYAQVGDRLYTRHAVNRMHPSGRHTTITQPRPEDPISVSHGSAIYVGGSLDYGRSISPNFIEDVIRMGSSRIEVRDGIARTIFTSGTTEVVTEQGGRIVITVVTR